MEQLAARRAHNPKVGGSSPSPATTRVANKGGLLFWEGGWPFCFGGGLLCFGVMAFPIV